MMNISSSTPSVSAPQPAQTNLASTPAKKAQSTQGENIINILKNVFDVKAYGLRNSRISTIFI